VCGIAGIVGFEGDPAELGAILGTMANALAHRGPDGEGVVVDHDQRAGLLCRRLALVGVVDGHQPVSSEDGSVVAVVNGEIYNHVALRRQLEARDHHFDGHSDAEVLVHLYEDRGDTCLDQLDGMFGLALLDRTRRRLLLARDGAGMKSLWYSATERGFVFASEAKALFASGLVSPRPDWDAIDVFLAVGFLPAPRTCFEGVSKLAAGHRLIVDDSGVEEQAFAEFTYASADPIAPGDAADELEDLLRKAVGTHLAADVPVGAFLSGGWDSSLLSTFAAEAVGGSLPTFSIVLPDHPSVDEGVHSREMAAFLGSDHHEIPFRASDVPRLLPLALWHREEPAPGPALLEYQLAATSSTHVKAVLSGQGSDELFGGYPWYRAGRRWYTLRRLVPRVAARPLASWAAGTRWRDGLRVLAAVDGPAADVEWLRAITIREKRQLGFPAGPDIAPFVLADAVRASCRDVLQRRMALDLTRRLADGLLTTADRMSMAHGLEVRMPFLDRSVIAFARRLPSTLAVDGENAKAVLAPIARRHLPASIANRQKRGLQYPVNDWLNGQLRSYVREILLDSPTPGVLDRRALEAFLRRWSTLTPPNLRAPWALLVLQVWWNVFFTSASPATAPTTR
jgi:asparagine synthase (glutamine-hydrolysing)